MSWWHSILLGLVQGLAEFLPISSSGHLVLLREILGINGEFMLFDVLLHAATLIAIIAAFFKEFIALFKPPFKSLGLLLLASVPAAVLGLLFNDKIESLFSSAKYLCFFFAGSAVIMLVADLVARRIKNTKRIGVGASLIMGAAQAAAMFPGITRSGSTICAGLCAKGERTEVARFSFFMSGPVILGAILLTSIDVAKGGGTAVPVYCYILGMAVAFVSGYFAIRWMMKLVAKANLKWFALYLGVVSILTFVFCFLGVGR